MWNRKLGTNVLLLIGLTTFGLLIRIYMNLARPWFPMGEGAELLTRRPLLGGGTNGTVELGTNSL